MPPLLAIAEIRQTALQGARKLEGIEAEHGQREEHEQGSESGQDPGVLKSSLEILSEQPGEHTGDGVGYGHGQHVDAGEEKRLAGGDVSALTREYPRENGDHREHARGEGEQ